VSRSRSNSIVLSLPFGNDAIVGGELPVDHARDEDAFAHLEEQMVLAGLELNIALASPSSFRVRAASSSAG
jgi:hypothetical protein